jgi:hypothetical protein
VCAKEIADRYHDRFCERLLGRFLELRGVLIQRAAGRD